MRTVTNIANEPKGRKMHLGKSLCLCLGLQDLTVFMHNPTENFPHQIFRGVISPHTLAPYNMTRFP